MKKQRRLAERAKRLLRLASQEAKLEKLESEILVRKENLAAKKRALLGMCQKKAQVKKEAKKAEQVVKVEEKENVVKIKEEPKEEELVNWGYAYA